MSKEVITVQQECDLPIQVEVIFLSLAENYQQQSQYARRQLTSSRYVSTVLLPMVLSEQHAKALAERILFDLWNEKISFQFELPIKYAYLEPTDIIDISIGEKNFLVRVTSIFFGNPGIVRVTAVRVGEDSKNIPNNFVVAHMESVNVNHLIEWYYIDKVGFRNSFVVACNKGNIWKGALLYVSEDNGENFSLLTEVEHRGVIGATLNKLEKGASELFDFTNHIEVNLLTEEELYSVSEHALLNGSNLALIGDELIQFLNAELVQPSQYKLTGLLRGRAGTEYAISSHEVGDIFVLLNDNQESVNENLSFLGITKQYKMAAPGSSLDSFKPRHIKQRGNYLKPLSPVHISVKRLQSMDLEISWFRRARINANWKDSVDVPLDEASELYEIEIFDDLQNLRRTLISNHPSSIYSFSQQEQDNVNELEYITICIYQISSIVGKGIAGKYIFYN